MRLWLLILFFFFVIKVDARIVFYDINLSFAENYAKGPHSQGALPLRTMPDKGKWHSFLGYAIASRVGIPACCIMTSKGIALAAQLGFDVLTYKTIRSVAMLEPPLPHICYVDCPGPITIDDIGGVVHETHQPPQKNEDIALSNSFGIISSSLDVIINDIACARKSLQEGQILIVSIFGTEQEHRSMIEDFVFIAKVAYHAGAHIIEANLSCPNVGCKEPLYKNPALVYEITHAITQAIPEIPLIAKVGLFDDTQNMKEMFCAAYKGGARGICGINSVPMRVINDENKPVFGQGRCISGVSGMPIHDVALQFIKDAREIIEQENLDLVLLATGGVTAPEHFQEFLNAGADIVLSATGAIYNPYVAYEYHQKYEE